MSTYPQTPRTPRTAPTSHDPELVNREVLEICDYYLRERRKEGRRYTYRCPGCGGRRFEVEPVRGMAGCFSAECDLPTTTDALGIVAYMENLDTRGPQFRECLKKGYEILGIQQESDATTESGERGKNPTTNGASGAKSHKSHKSRSWIAGEAKVQDADTEDTEGKEDSENGYSPGPDTNTAADPLGDQNAEYPVSGGQLIEAYAELPDGTREPLEAFVVDEDDNVGQPHPDPRSSRTAISGPPANMESEKAKGEDSAPRADEMGQDDQEDPKQREVNHRVYETLLKLCPLEGREKEFFEGRGLDAATIEEGRFGSISKRRCRYVANRLECKFDDEELLTVPGFYRADSGQLRFTLYGDYALIPYYDREGYILTIEGRLIGEPTREADKKYKALAGSGVHLYVYPRFDPGEVVAFCEGAVGAMVAARAGIPVASIKGMRNYRCPPADRYGDYSVLPELRGVDFGGAEIVYFPDLDVKPKTRAEAFGIVPEACDWLIERQGGRATVAMLPEGSKDLDEWLLSLDEKERVKRFLELINAAVVVEEWNSADHTHETSKSDSRRQDQPTHEPTLHQVAEESKQSQDPPVSHTANPEPAGNSEKSPGNREDRGSRKARLLPDTSDDEEGQPSSDPGPGTVEEQTQSDESTKGSQEPEQRNDSMLPAPIAPTHHNQNDSRPQRKDYEDTGNGTSPVNRNGRNQHEADRGSALNEMIRDSTSDKSEHRSHPGLDFWHETRNLNEDRIEQIRKMTAEHQRSERHSELHPPRPSRRIHVPKWNAGEIAIALSVSVLAAAVILVGLYLAREQGGLVGGVGSVLTWPAWWIEFLTCWAIGLLVAEAVTGTRHRKRRRQMREHIRGGRR